MDNVQKYNILVNVPSSQTFKSYSKHTAEGIFIKFPSGNATNHTSGTLPRK
jgi:hypothetical protein